MVEKLARILSHGALGGSGKLLIYPVDQGIEHGPIQSFTKNESAYDPDYHFRLAIEAGCSALALPLGSIELGARDYAGEIPLILKLNSANNLFKDSEKPYSVIISDVEQALELGCSAIGFTIYPGSPECGKMLERLFPIIKQAKKWGLASVVWSYPRGGGVSKKGEQALDVVGSAAHLAASLGAGIIKVKPPSGHIEDPGVKLSWSDTKTFHAENLSLRVPYILKSAFNGKRIVIFSGGPSKDKSSLLEEVKELAKGGAFGSIIGRNIFTRPFKESLELLKEIIHIYKEQAQREQNQKSNK